MRTRRKQKLNQLFDTTGLTREAFLSQWLSIIKNSRPALISKPDNFTRYNISGIDLRKELKRRRIFYELLI